MEDGAQKVERWSASRRRVRLSRRIGQDFKGIVTARRSKGTWVRNLRSARRGPRRSRQDGLDVGDRVRVRLVHTNPERGFIDFHRVG